MQIHRLLNAKACEEEEEQTQQQAFPIRRPARGAPMPNARMQRKENRAARMVWAVDSSGPRFLHLEAPPSIRQRRDRWIVVPAHAFTTAAAQVLPACMAIHGAEESRKPGGDSASLPTIQAGRQAEMRWFFEPSTARLQDTHHPVTLFPSFALPPAEASCAGAWSCLETRPRPRKTESPPKSNRRCCSALLCSALLCSG